MSETIYVDRTTTWHAIGKDVQECKSMEAVLSASGLDYTVEKKPVFMNHDDSFTKIPNRFITVRNSDEHPYDVVSDKFEVIQNRDAFDFVDYMDTDLTYEKAGETQGGMVYVIAKMPSVNILGDEFTPHVIFRNGFSGKFKISAAICPLRIVCQNQFNFAFKDTQNSVTIRHVQNAEAKLVEARETMKMTANYMTQLNTMAETYAGKKLTERQLNWCIDMMFPKPQGEDLTTLQINKMEDARRKFMNAYLAEDNANFKGTAWGLVNAYTDYMTHKDIISGPVETRDESKFTKTTFGKPMNNVIDIINKVA